MATIRVISIRANSWPMHWCGPPRKGYQANRPQTLCRLTEAGRTRFLEYITVLENVVADALAASSKSERLPLGAPAEGWSPA